MSRSGRWWVVLATTCFAGCAGGADAPASASMTDVGTGGADQMMLGTGGMGAAGAGTGGMSVASGPPSFTRVWTEVLVNKGCTSVFCHGMAMSTSSLQMDNSALAYANLVGVAAAGPKCGASGKVRVVAGDPDNSLMLDKLSHAPPSCGDTMPLGAKLDPGCVSLEPSVCNTAAEIQLVHDWIANGALND